jgi:hypothetical protein
VVNPDENDPFAEGSPSWAVVEWIRSTGHLTHAPYDPEVDWISPLLVEITITLGPNEHRFRLEQHDDGWAIIGYGGPLPSVPNMALVVTTVEEGERLQPGYIKILSHPVEFLDWS